MTAGASTPRRAAYYREAVRDMKPREAVEYLLEVIEWTSGGAETGTARAVINGTRLEPMQDAVLRLLAKHEGHVVLSEAIEQVLRGRRTNPDIYYNDAAVSTYRLRKILAETGVKIISSYGQGYTLIAPPGHVWPWEAGK